MNTPFTHFPVILKIDISPPFPHHLLPVPFPLRKAAHRCRIEGFSRSFRRERQEGREGEMDGVGEIEAEKGSLRRRRQRHWKIREEQWSMLCALRDDVEENARFGKHGIGKMEQRG